MRWKPRQLTRSQLEERRLEAGRLWQAGHLSQAAIARHLHRILTSYLAYYHYWRTHLSLEMDCPEPRPIQPSTLGPVRAVPEVGGLHHHYERWAA